MSGLGIEDVLAAHEWYEGLESCRCGWEPEDRLSCGCGTDDAHRGHVAAILRGQIAALAVPSTSEGE